MLYRRKISAPGRNGSAIFRMSSYYNELTRPPIYLGHFEIEFHEFNTRYIHFNGMCNLKT